ncbi:MAG: response regulator [Chloroflexi bacterium]|nr:response regulator [Chloroflexota bacterium]
MARILIVDDEPDVRAAMTASLEDAGHSVIQAPDGTEVLEIAVGQRPDMIFLDLSMPRVNGFEALHMLKADPRARDIPVIIVSAKGRPEDRIRTRAMGAMDYINKPWGDGELLVRVNFALAAAARKAQNQGGSPQVPAPAGSALRAAPVRAPASQGPVGLGPSQAQRTVIVRPAQPVQRPLMSMSAARKPAANSTNGAASLADEGSHLIAARFVVQHEYSATQTQAPRTSQSKSAAILRPVEDKDWVVRFDTFDVEADARAAPGVPLRFIYGVRGVARTKSKIGIFSEWELGEATRVTRFEANRSTLFEIHRRQLPGMVSEWMLQRLDEPARYTILAMFADEDNAVRFRGFNPPEQYATMNVLTQFGASELYGLCTCRVTKPT